MGGGTKEYTFTAEAGCPQTVALQVTYAKRMTRNSQQTATIGSSSVTYNLPTTGGWSPSSEQVLAVNHWFTLTTGANTLRVTDDDGQNTRLFTLTTSTHQ
ncbi:unnamed protein product, partial [Prorocentrum cordatum]